MMFECSSQSIYKSHSLAAAVGSNPCPAVFLVQQLLSLRGSTAWAPVSAVWGQRTGEPASSAERGLLTASEYCV